MAKRPKVLYTASTFSHLATFHQPYLQWFAQHGCEVHAAAGQEPRELTGVTHAVSLPFEKRMFSPKNLTAVRQLARLLCAERYDLISTHTSLAAFFTRLAVLLADKGDTVVMNTAHGYLFDTQTPLPKRMLLLGAEKLTAGVTDYVLTMNRQDYATAQRHHLGTQLIQTDGMGIDFSRFQPVCSEEKAQVRTALGVPQDALLLVYAAEFSARKNHRMLIEAMKRLPENIWLLLPGRGALLEDCRSLAKNCGVAERVLFPGFVRGIENCYHASDICVSSSRIEGLPFNIAEAMGCGLPVAATAIKGHEDLVEDQISGRLFPYNDIEGFVQAIGQMRNPQIRMRMGAAAQRSVQRFGRKNVFPQLTAVYERALESRFSAKE
ncbi:MAG: glycosyltransferase [Bacillota bacterium]|nr:glycosyltransferase [Bacillota bacterium]